MRTDRHKKGTSGKFMFAVILLLTLLPAILLPTAFAAGQLMFPVRQELISKCGCIPPDETFSYQLTPESNDNPMPDGNSGGIYIFDITGIDEVEIGPIIFTHAGTYFYEIHLIEEIHPNCECDTSSYTLEILVDNTLNVITIAYNKNGTKVSEIVFEHGYDLLSSDPNDMRDPPLIKTVIGNASSNDVFTFQLKAGNADWPMPEGSVNGVKTITIKGSGQSEFGVWSYTAEGTYTYTVSEINSGDRRYVYDTAVYTITDTVTALDGKLVVERVVKDNGGLSVNSMSFVNEFKGRGPNTGDSSPMILYAALAGASGLMILVVLLVKGSRRRKNTK